MLSKTRPFKPLYWVLALLLAWAVYCAPATDFLATKAYIRNAVLLNSTELHPAELVLFNAMGIWPAITAVLLLASPTERRAAAPFVAGSFLLGMFSLTPYLLLLRGPVLDECDLCSAAISRPKRLAKVAACLVVLSLALCWFALVKGDAEALRHACYKHAFAFVMSVDFLCFWLASFDLIRLSEREDSFAGAARFALVPLVGPALYLYSKSLRPPILNPSAHRLKAE